jgi:hypothetical protein
MHLKPWLALFLAAGCVDHPNGHPVYAGGSALFIVIFH